MYLHFFSVMGDISNPLDNFLQPAWHGGEQFLLTDRDSDKIAPTYTSNKQKVVVRS
jgi:hypothetical protein